jgi:dihydroorotate dehydrogenase (NAD+) catalytic subunit
MAVNAETRRPVLSTITGGLSGPAIKPIALRMVWQVYNAVKIPVIGMGGIMNATDAIEFMLAGASAIQVGTAIFIDPTIPVQIVDGIADYMQRHKIDSVKDLIGGLQC